MMQMTRVIQQGNPRPYASQRDDAEASVVKDPGLSLAVVEPQHACQVSTQRATVSYDCYGIAIGMTSNDVLYGRHDTLLKWLYTFFTRNGHPPRIPLPTRHNLRIVGTHLFKGHPSDCTAIVLFQAAFTDQVQPQMLTDDLGSLACPQQWAGVQGTQILFMLQAMRQLKGLLSTDLGQWLIVQALNATGSIACRLCVSYQE